MAPDPSILRVHEDYYIANSTFSLESRSADLPFQRSGKLGTHHPCTPFRWGKPPGTNTPAGIWAPHLSYDGKEKKFWLTFSSLLQTWPAGSSMLKHTPCGQTHPWAMVKAIVSDFNWIWSGTFPWQSWSALSIRPRMGNTHRVSGSGTFSYRPGRFAAWRHHWVHGIALPLDGSPAAVWKHHSFITTRTSIICSAPLLAVPAMDTV